MAATFCNLNSGFCARKLNEYFLKQSCATWSNLGVSYAKTSKQPSEFCCNATKFFHKIHRRQLFEIKRYRQWPQALIDGSDNSHISEREEDVDRAALIWRAIKLPIYSVALVPLTVGSAAAYLQTGVFSATRYIVVLASSVLIIGWLNLSNDVYDFDTGADKNKKESVVNLVGSRSGTLIAAYSSLALGFMALTWISIAAGNMRAILLLATAIVCGYIYQCPPFRLSYQGLGEPLCFAAFGPFATTAFYLLLGSTSEMNNLPLSWAIFSSSILVGFTTSLILFCSHFHQVEEDLAVEKISPLVILGTERGAIVVKVAIAALYSILLAFGLSKWLPFACIVLCAFTLPVANLVVNFVGANHKDKEKIFMAKYYCVRLHTLFGAALAAGLVAARMLTKEYIPRSIFH